MFGATKVPVFAIVDWSYSASVLLLRIFSLVKSSPLKLVAICALPDFKSVVRIFLIKISVSNLCVVSFTMFPIAITGFFCCFNAPLAIIDFFNSLRGHHAPRNDSFCTVSHRSNIVPYWGFRAGWKPAPTNKLFDKLKFDFLEQKTRQRNSLPRHLYVDYANRGVRALDSSSFCSSASAMSLPRVV